MDNAMKWWESKVPIILASGSPRRKELLGMICEDFDILVSDCEEMVTSKVPEEVTAELANQKARAVALSGKVKGRALVIGADTVVSIDDEILGKPEDKENAYQMIQMISGRSHKVSTGVSLVLLDENGNIIKEKSFAETTLVKVAALSAGEITEYVNSDEPYDKAGAYGIQGLFGKHIEGIEGDYNNVVGLPVHRLYEELKSFEIYEAFKQDIKNIVLDVGDVLLEYRWKDMLTDYGLSKEDAEFLGTMLFGDPLWEEFDVALRPRQDIIDDYIRKYPNYENEIRWFMSHGERMHIPRPEVWERVHALKEKGYGIYILSNYSEELFQIHTKDATFLEDADGIVVSYQVHKIKPEPEIYEHLLKTYGLKAEECIFFDDRPANTEGAARVGMHVVTVTSKQQLIEQLEKF